MKFYIYSNANSLIIFSMWCCAMLQPGWKNKSCAFFRFKWLWCFIIVIRSSQICVGMRVSFKPLLYQLRFCVCAVTEWIYIGNVGNYGFVNKILERVFLGCWWLNFTCFSEFSGKSCFFGFMVRWILSCFYILNWACSKHIVVILVTHFLNNRDVNDSVRFSAKC